MLTSRNNTAILWFASGLLAIILSTSWLVITSSKAAPYTPQLEAPQTTTTPTPTSTATSTCAGSWNPVPLPNYITQTFFDIEADSANDIWAVGGSALHWDGTQWTWPSDPIPINALGVAVVSANDVWAVGTDYNVFQIQLAHWNGTQWSAVPPPNIGRGFLYGVDARSADDVWAVGGYFAGSGGNETHSLILHWDGTEWSVIATPSLSAWNELANVEAISANDVWVVGVDGGNSLIMHWDGSEWSVVPSPNGGVGGNDLRSISAVSANDIWAVGRSGYHDNYQTLALHWNGIEWSLVSGPSMSSAMLLGVASISSDNVWAVGSNRSIYPYQTLIEHWNGSQWSVVSSPSPGSSWDLLYAISAVSADEIWTAGTDVQRYRNPCASTTPSALTPTPSYTATPACGSTWRTVASPNISGARQLTAVKAFSEDDVWAVGGSGILHWNGSNWSPVPDPNSGHHLALDGVAPNDLWAVGLYPSGPILLEHWNGATWSAFPSPSNGILRAVSASASNDAWAVGSFGPDLRTLVQHWNGTEWSVVPSPNPGFYNYLVGVEAISANDVWVVGHTYDPAAPNFGYRTLTMHWNGTQWSVVPSPNPGPNYNYLYGVTAISSNDIWAVGKYGTDVDRSLVLHWDGAAWNVVPSPNVPGAIGNILLGVTALSTQDAWAVGYSEYSGSEPFRLALSLHWDGTVWNMVPNPNPSASQNVLNGVSATSPGEAWTVGFYNNVNHYSNTLTQHFSDPCITPTPTPNRILVGHIAWQGRPLQPNAFQQLPITLTLKSASSEINFTQRTTDSSGFFTVSVGGLANGAYTWRVKGPSATSLYADTNLTTGFLAVTGTVTLAGAPITQQEIGLMRTADCNNDNLITALDFNIFKPSFGRSSGDPAYDNRADFTGDHTITVLDFNLIKQNFGLSGAPPP